VYGHQLYSHLSKYFDLLIFILLSKSSVELGYVSEFIVLHYSLMETRTGAIRPLDFKYAVVKIGLFNEAVCLPVCRFSVVYCT